MSAHHDPVGGFTLIEVLVALMILGVALMTLMSALLSNTSLNTKIDRKAEAIRISEEVLESYRQSGNYGTLRTNISNTVIKRGVNYTVNTEFCPADTPSTMNCSTTSVYIKVEVKNGNAVLQRAATYYTEFGKE